MKWDEKLRKAEKSLADSKKCFELYGDSDSKQWIAEDEKWDEKLRKAEKSLADSKSKQWIAEDEEKVREIKKHIAEVIEFMDAHNIK